MYLFVIALVATVFQSIAELRRNSFGAACHEMRGFSSDSACALEKTRRRAYRECFTKAAV